MNDVKNPASNSTGMRLLENGFVIHASMGKIAKSLKYEPEKAGYGYIHRTHRTNYKVHGSSKKPHEGGKGVKYIKMLRDEGKMI